eukprot:COSAG01_NODE_38318_length_491_cov_0.969388_1_plen_78_part_10
MRTPGGEALRIARFDEGVAASSTGRMAAVRGEAEADRQQLVRTLSSSLRRERAQLQEAREDEAREEAEALEAERHARE